MLSQIPIYKIRINYKSGHSEEMEVISFDFEKTGATVSLQWEQPKGTIIRPIHINVEEIESIWQVGVRDG
jgi:hypothetical protein